MDRVVQSPYWRESLHIAASITSMRNPNPYSCILTNSICIVATLTYRSVVLMMLLCVNLLKSPTLTWMKRYLPTTLGNWKVHRCPMILLMISQNTFWNHDGPYLVAYWRYNLRQRWEPTPISRYLGMLQQADIIQDILIYHLKNRWTFQFLNGVGRYPFIRSRVGRFQQIYT